MKCKRCGSEIPDNTKFCPCCGMPSNSGPKKHKKGCLIPLVIVLAIFVVAVVGGIISIKNNSTSDQPNLIVNVIDYAGKSAKEIQTLVGELKDGGSVDLTDASGRTVQGKSYYLPDSGTTFTFVDDKLVSFQYYANNPVNYKSEKDIIRMFGITPSENLKQEANTGVALRYSSVSNEVSEFWVQEMDSKAKTFSIVKITFDSNLAGKFANEPEKADLEVLEYADTNDGYVGYITGKIKNNTDKTYRYVQVSINLYSDDTLIGSTFANVNNLGAGAIWEFRAPVLYEECNRYKIVDVSGY